MAMASSPTAVILLVVCLAGSCLSDTSADLPVENRDLPVADITTTPPTSTSGSGDPTVSTPGETFSENGDLGDNTVSDVNGDPGVSAKVLPSGVPTVIAANSNPAGDLQNDESRVDAIAAGRKRQMRRASRKMLQLGTLDLSGGGVSAGDADAGVAANAYGHGELGDDVANPTDKHIEPHGVDGTVTTAGEATTVGAGADPDCTAALEGINEGDCVTATAGK